MLVGIKIYNNVIVVDNDGLEVKIVFEVVKEKGKLIGFVVILEIIYVILVFFGLYDYSWKNMNLIVDDYFDEMVNGKYKIDVFLGGGKSNFDCKDCNLIKEFKKVGYSYVDNCKDMLKNKDS